MTSADVQPKPYLSKRAKARHLWIVIHRWLGIALLIPMALLGLTGSALVWPVQTEQVFAPARTVSADADPVRFTQDHIATARAALAQHGPVTALRFGDPGEPLRAGTGPIAPPHMGIGPPTRMTAFIDPQSGELLQVAASTGDFMWFMHAIHGHLLLKGVGRPVVGVMGLLLLLSAITGLVVWWPGRGKILAALKWRKREGKLLNIHRQFGVVLSLVLLAEALTGAWISFPAVFAAVIEPDVVQSGGDHHSAPAPAAAAALVAPIIQDAEWGDALDIALAAFPGRAVGIQAPDSDEGHWSMTIAGERGTAEVSVAYRSAVAVVAEAAPPGRAAVVGGVMEAVHAAQVGGWLWQWLTFLSGIALTFLSISGVYVWAKRQIVRRRSTQRPIPARNPA